MFSALIRFGHSWLKNTVSRAAQAWNCFWFTPEDPFLLGVMRLLTGWMLTYNLAVWSLDLEAFFSADGLQPLAAVQELQAGQLVFCFWKWVPDDWMWTAHWTSVAISVLYFLGFATRVTSVLAFLITISYSQRVPVANFGLDQVLGMLCMYLAIGPSGASLSLDSLIRRKWFVRQGKAKSVADLRSVSACVAMRLMQLHLCAIYFWAGFSKLKGASWWTGEAMWRVLANAEYQTMDLTWMAWIPWMPFLVAHVTIAWEVSFIALVWNRQMRPLILTIGTLMHFGIGAFLGMWTFGLSMTFAYFSFANSAAWRRRTEQLLVAMRSRVARVKANRPVVATEQSKDSHAPQSAISHLSSVAVKTEVLQSPKLRVIAFAIRSNDRQQLRTHLTQHGMECRAFESVSQAVHIWLPDVADVVVVFGCDYADENLLAAVCDIRDQGPVPVIVVVSPSQAEYLQGNLVSDVQILTASPVSMQDIRLAVESLVRDHSSSAPTRSSADL